eukprot:1929842-Pyramimonas_sp.AAC.1
MEHVPGRTYTSAIMAIVEKEAAKKGMTAEDFLKKLRMDFLNEQDEEEGTKKERATEKGVTEEPSTKVKDPQTPPPAADAAKQLKDETPQWKVRSNRGEN